MKLWPFKRKRNMKVAYFDRCWQDLQKNCNSRKTWPTAITEADDLLEKALKQAGFRGKTTGERLVAAQRTISSNETVWHGHKLRNTLNQPNVDVRKLKKKDMVIALSGFRDALKDLGALPND